MFLEFYQLPVSPAVTSCPYLWVILLSEGHYRHSSGDRLVSSAWGKQFRARAKVVSGLSHHRFFFQTFCLWFIFNMHLFLFKETVQAIVITKTRTVRILSMNVQAHCWVFFSFFPFTNLKPNLYIVYVSFCILWCVLAQNQLARWGMSTFYFKGSLLNWEENLFHTFWRRKEASFSRVDWFMYCMYSYKTHTLKQLLLSFAILRSFCEQKVNCCTPFMCTIL